MKGSIKELEKIISSNLLLTVNLNNEVASKELENQDQLKEISLGIIDILDSFERAEVVIKEKKLDENDHGLMVAKRYKIIQKKLINLLKKYGITQIDFPDNRLIIGLCEVVDTEFDNNRQNDEIISVLRNGYIRGNKLIRAAQVIIVKK